MKELSNPEPGPAGSNEWLNNLYSLEPITIPTAEELDASPNEEPNEFVALSKLYDIITNTPEPLDVKPGTAVVANNDGWQQMSCDVVVPDETVAIAKGSKGTEAQPKPVLTAEGDGRVFVVHDPQSSAAAVIKMPYIYEGTEARTAQQLDKMAESFGPLSAKARGFVCSPTDSCPGETDFFGLDEQDKLANQKDNQYFREILSQKTGINEQNITVVEEGYWQNVQVDPESGDVVVSSLIQEDVDAVTVREVKRHSPGKSPELKEEPTPQPFIGQEALNNILPLTSKILNEPITKLDIWLKPAEGVASENLDLNNYSIRPSAVINTNPESDEVRFGFELIQEDTGQSAGHINLKMNQGFVEITEISKVSNTPDQQVDAGASLCEASLIMAKTAEYRVAIIDTVKMADNAIEDFYGGGLGGEVLPGVSLDFANEAHQYYTEMYADMAQKLGFQEMDAGLWRRALD